MASADLQYFSQATQRGAKETTAYPAKKVACGLIPGNFERSRWLLKRAYEQTKSTCAHYERYLSCHCHVVR